MTREELKQEQIVRYARIADEIRRKPNQRVKAVAKKFGVTDPTVYAAARAHGVALTGMKILQPLPPTPPTAADFSDRLSEEREQLLARVRKIDSALEVLRTL